MAETKIESRERPVAPNIGSWAYLLGIVAYLFVVSLLLLRRGGRLESYGFLVVILGGALGIRLLRVVMGERVGRRMLVASVVMYLVVVGAVMFRRGGFIEADNFLLLILAAAIILGDTLRFLRDWIPFAVILFAWQFLRGFADTALHGYGITVHVGDVVDMEKWLFRGTIPTIWLQQRLFVPNGSLDTFQPGPYCPAPSQQMVPAGIHWYDIVATAWWSFHFVLPLLFAFLLWAGNKRLYWRFVISLMTLSFLGFLIYMLYPAAPPWLASCWRAIPQNVYLIRDAVLGQIHLQWNFSVIVSHANPDAVAAMPSLHAAYPTLVFWFTLFYWRKLVPLAVLYCFGLWFSVVYIGDHYVVDVLAGVILATLTFFVVRFIYNLIQPDVRPVSAEAFTVEPVG